MSSRWLIHKREERHVGPRAAAKKSPPNPCTPLPPPPLPPPPPPRRGETTVKQLASGNFGAVYVAKDCGKDVACPADQAALDALPSVAIKLHVAGGDLVLGGGAGAAQKKPPSPTDMAGLGRSYLSDVGGMGR